MGLLARITGRTRVQQTAADHVAARDITIGTSTRGTYTGELAPSIVRAIERGRLGGWDPILGGGWVPRDIALRVPAVRRGVRVITSAISQLPLVRWRNDEPIDSGPLLRQPEEWRPYHATLTATLEDLILHGEAWWYVVRRDRFGFPAKVVCLHADQVQTETEPGSDEIVREFVTYRGRQLPSRDLVRFDGPDEGLLVHGAGTILTALTLEQAADRYASPEVPTGVLRNESQYELTDDEVTALLSQWSAARSTNTTAFLNAGVSYETMQSTAAELQLTEGREQCALQISRHLGLPPRYVNASDGSSMTYSNITTERRELVDLSLAPYILAVEQRLSMNDRNGSPQGQSVHFDLSSFLRGSPEERAALYAQLIPLGVMTVEEARAAERRTSSRSTVGDNAAPQPQQQQQPQQQPAEQPEQPAPQQSAPEDEDIDDQDDEDDEDEEGTP